jgi:hypothetical protein
MAWTELHYALEWWGEYFLPWKPNLQHAMSTNDFDTDILRYGYQSMATPSSVIDFNTKDSIGLKRANKFLGKDGRIIMKHRSFYNEVTVCPSTVCRCNDYDVWW